MKKDQRHLTTRLQQRLWPAGAAMALALLALTGCGGGPSQTSGGSAGDQVLRVAQTAEPTTLDPAKVPDGPTIELLMQVFEGLVQWTPENKLAPALAEKWDVSADGKTYTFHLRKDAKFHNGRAVTADDFVYSLTRSLDPKTKSTVSMVYLDDIVGARAVSDGSATTVKGLSAPDDHTLRITIDAPKAYFLSKLTYPTGYVVCKEAVESTGGEVQETSMIGTGPFKLGEYRRADRVVLEAYPDYWGGAPKLARMERRILLDPGTRHDTFRAGGLEMTTIGMAFYRADKQDPELATRIKVFKRPATFYLALNQKAFEPFRDRRVRQAFAHAVDKREIVDSVWEGVPPVAQGILPEGIPGFDPQFKGLQFDPQRARQLLAEAGYPNGTGFPTLTLSFRASEDDIRNTATAVQADLQKNLGIKVNLDEVEWTTFLARRNKGEMPFYFLRWMADYLDPQNFLSTMLYSKAPENTIGYANPEFDRLCDQADRMQNAAQRLALYRKAEALAVNDAPWVPIFYQTDVELWSPRLQGVDTMLMGHLPHKRTHLAP